LNRVKAAATTEAGLRARELQVRRVLAWTELRARSAPGLFRRLAAALPELRAWPGLELHQDWRQRQEPH